MTIWAFESYALSVGVSLGDAQGLAVAVCRWFRTVGIGPAVDVGRLGC